MRRSRQRGFTLLEVLVATLLMAIAVTSLMSNLSTSTANLMRATDLDRLTALTKSKMDELITRPGLMNGVVEGPFAVGSPARGGWRATIFVAGVANQGGGDRLERIQLETWLEVGGKRRTMFLETYRRVPGPGASGG